MSKDSEGYGIHKVILKYRKYILYKEYYANTVLILESKDSKITQRIGDETFINYDLITKNTFYKGRDVDHNLIIEQYKVGICEFKIHKNTNICRSTINKIIKEYNSPTSAQQPKS